MFYSLIAIIADVPNQLQEGFIMPLSVGLSGTVVFFVVTIAISVAILVKSRKNILSQKVNTQHFTKPPAGNQNHHVHSIML